LNRRTFGGESARMIILSLVLGAAGFFLLMVLGSVLNTFVW
jgi:hypothetical protein